MIFSEFNLTGTSQRELDTEIKYSVASARADGTELISLRFDDGAFGAVLRILRALKRDGVVQFFVSASELAAGKREAEFILNKYGEYVNYDENDMGLVFVKI